MLAGEGCTLVVHGRNRERAEEAAHKAGAAGVPLGDLGTDEGAAAVHGQARAVLSGFVEILVNNAGGSEGDSSTRRPMDVTIAKWIEQYQGNTLGAVRLAQHVLPDIFGAKWGRIINISSPVALQPNYLGSDYSGAKASLNNFTVTLAGSLHSSGATVNTVSPGVIMTNGLIRFARATSGQPEMTIDAISTQMVRL